MGTAISPEELDDVVADQGVDVREGDVLLGRTGWRRKFMTDKDKAGFKAGEPGLSVRCVDWLHRQGVAAVGSDNFAVEVLPGEYEDEYLPVHMLTLWDMGMRSRRSSTWRNWPPTVPRTASTSSCSRVRPWPSRVASALR